MGLCFNLVGWVLAEQALLVCFKGGNRMMRLTSAVMESSFEERGFLYVQKGFALGLS